MMKKLFFIITIVIFAFFPNSVFSETNENKVFAILIAKVTSTFDESSTPIADARIIVINSIGKIIGTKLTNSEGIVHIPVIVDKDPRFPTKQIG